MTNVGDVNGGKPVSCWRPGSICRVHTVILLLYLFFYASTSSVTYPGTSAGRLTFLLNLRIVWEAWGLHCGIGILECDIVYFDRTLSCFGGIFFLNHQGKEEFARGKGRKVFYCFAQGLRPRPSPSSSRGPWDWVIMTSAPTSFMVNDSNP